MTPDTPPRCLLLLLLTLGAPAAAHDLWIEPSAWRAEPGRQIAVALRVGDGFAGEPVPRDARRLLELAAFADGASTPLPGVDGLDPAGFFQPPRPGSYTLAYRSRPIAIQLAGEKFTAYLGEEGLERIVALRDERGETDRLGRERYSRCAKALIRVGETAAAPAGGSPPSVATPVGCPVELVPLTDPYAPDFGGAMEIELRVEGQPRAGVLVEAMAAADPGARLSRRTDRHGRARFELISPGAWLVAAVHMEPAPPESGADWESWWASLTFSAPGR